MTSQANPPHPEETDADIAHRVKTALNIEGLPITELSLKTGLSEKTLRRSLAGHRSFTFNEFSRIANAVKQTPSTILKNSIFLRDVA